MNHSRLFIAAGILGFSFPLSADLFFSEYIEGSANNKALEIYNSSSTAVDLSSYQIRMYFNGQTTAATTLSLSGSIAAGDVYVIADDNSDATILSQADYTPSNSFFNGDDAIELLNNGLLIDSIGQVGLDPGAEWGTGDVSTQNNTLRRLSSVTTGDSNSSDAFDPALEWEGLVQDSFDGLGSYNGGSTPAEIQFAYIHDIQGADAVSPLSGSSVTIEAIVVGDFQNNSAIDNGNLNGFYVQEEDSDADTDAATSEGIFVYDGNANIDVQVGDKVVISGTVKEYYNLTELAASSVQVVASGVDLPTVTQLTLPLTTANELEAYEGMLVRFPQDLVISEYFNFDRYGEIVLAQPLHGEQRPLTPTAIELPGSAEYQARMELNALSRIVLDDGRSSENPDPAYHPNGGVFDLNNYFRGGDRVQNATGIMDFRYSLYRLQPTLAANHIITNPRPEVPPYIDADIKVASFNVLNYFTTLDENANHCGPDLTLDCRGADNAEEFTRQRDKIIQAISAINADIVGLIEIENNDSASIDDLVDGLNALMGYGTYTKLDTGTIGGDAIKLAFIYQPAKVRTIGDYALLNSSVDARFIDDKNRPSLAQTFMLLSNAARFTVALNHLKSKGSDCNDLGDTDLGDGQGNCNLTRTAAAQALVEWLASNPTGHGDGDVLIIGDLNSYDKEAPISAITAAGYSDLVLRDEGEQAYTYVFDGQAGYLDYALANESLVSQTVAAHVWHINADEADLFDYDTSFKQDAQDALYEPNAFRSSDHDPVIIGLNPAARIDDMMLFINASVSEGSLLGNGRKASKHLAQFIRLMQQGNKAENHGRMKKACALLTTAERYADSVPHPEDLIKGESVATVAQMIAAYRQQNCTQHSHHHDNDDK